MNKNISRFSVYLELTSSLSELMLNSHFYFLLVLWLILETQNEERFTSGSKWIVYLTGVVLWRVKKNIYCKNILIF